MTYPTVTTTPPVGLTTSSTDELAWNALTITNAVPSIECLWRTVTLNPTDMGCPNNQSFLYFEYQRTANDPASLPQTLAQQTPTYVLPSGLSQSPLTAPAMTLQVAHLNNLISHISGMNPPVTLPQPTMPPVWTPFPMM